MKILVTGGGGFLGSALARRLAGSGHQVRSFSRGTYPELASLGIETSQGDLGDEIAVALAAEGCDVIFHVAAKAGVWGTYEEYYKANVVGTQNVLAACKKLGIKRLVYTSTPSVIFDGHGHEGVNESAPYPTRFLNHYSHTKALAEEMVLNENSPDLAVVSLRPHMIWGPGDNHLIPRIIARAKSGKLRIVGDGRNLVDSVYIENAIDAHMLALEKLTPDSPIAGKAYFITNDEPVPMGDLLNKVLAAGGIPPCTKRMPAPVAFMAGGIMEFLFGMVRSKEEPLMTRFLARELSQPHWFDISAARRDLGYSPGISIDEGMKKLKEWLEQKT